MHPDHTAAAPASTHERDLRTIGTRIARQGRRSRRFQLGDLAPTTRALFRAYRDAMRECRRLELAAQPLRETVAMHRSIVWHAEQVGRQPSAVVREELAKAEARQAAHQQRWQTAVDRAREACEAARPAMEAAGYPFGWWHTGTMRIPAGQQPPEPLWGDTQANRYRPHLASDCPRWPAGCRRCRRVS